MRCAGPTLLLALLPLRIPSLLILSLHLTVDTIPKLPWRLFLFLLLPRPLWEPGEAAPPIGRPVVVAITTTINSRAEATRVVAISIRLISMVRRTVMACLVLDGETPAPILPLSISPLVLVLAVVNALGIIIATTITICSSTNSILAATPGREKTPSRGYLLSPIFTPCPRRPRPHRW